VLALAWLAPSWPVAAADLSSPVGLWKTIDDKTGAPRALVRIYAQDDRFQGRIEQSFTPGAQTRVCSVCTDERRNQPVIGLQIIRNMTRKGDEFSGGDILDPDNGWIYRCKFHLEDGGRGNPGRRAETEHRPAESARSPSRPWRGDSLAQLNIVNPIDLNGQVPGLVITQSEGYNRSVSIRGIGFNVPQNDSAQTSVSYHEDGIYIAFPVALDSGFLDVDHVEVLRGPQGTVFGQNAVGGTINVISRQPTFDGVNGFVDASAGSYHLEHLTAAINMPLSGTFAIRAALDQVTRRATSRRSTCRATRTSI
jgi:hypothetical protein